MMEPVLDEFASELRQVQPTSAADTFHFESYWHMDHC